MGSLENDPEYVRFCEELESLKGQTPRYRPRAGFTDRTMTYIRKNQAIERRSRPRRLLFSLHQWLSRRLPSIGRAVSRRLTFLRMEVFALRALIVDGLKTL